jgi:hypothetical protein
MYRLLWYNINIYPLFSEVLFLNLKQSRRKNGRIYLSIEKAYRDADGKPRAKTIKSLGYLDELEKIYDDPIAHFKLDNYVMEYQVSYGK